jgi:hypothetical protein
MAEAILAAAAIRDHFTYDPESGEVRWKHRASKRDPDVPLKSIGSAGYYKVMFRGRALQLHRLAWAFIHDKWPDCVLDHINGNRTDNRIANLREATWRQNAQNMKSRIGASGIRGVSWDPIKCKWRARLTNGGKYIFLGNFDDVLEAEQAYLAGKRKYHEHATV